MWSVWFNVCACKSVLRGRKLLVLSVVMQGLQRQPQQPLCTQQERPAARDVSSFTEGQEKGRIGKYRCACQDSEVSFCCFLQSCFPYKKSTTRIKPNIFIDILLFSWTGIYWLAIGDVPLGILKCSTYLTIKNILELLKIRSQGIPLIHTTPIYI